MMWHSRPCQELVVAANGGQRTQTESNGRYTHQPPSDKNTQRHVSSALFFLYFNSFCLFVCRPWPCQLTFLHPEPWRAGCEGGGRQWAGQWHSLYDEGTNTTYKLHPLHSPQTNKGKKRSVCLECPRLSGHHCQRSVMMSWQLQQQRRVGWPSAGRGGFKSPTHPESWQMSYTSSMGTFCFLFTFLHPAALGLLSCQRTHTHTIIWYKHQGERQRRDMHLTDMSFSLYSLLSIRSWGMITSTDRENSGISLLWLCYISSRAFTQCFHKIIIQGLCTV